MSVFYDRSLAFFPMRSPGLCCPIHFRQSFEIFTFSVTKSDSTSLFADFIPLHPHTKFQSDPFNFSVFLFFCFTDLFALNEWIEHKKNCFWWCVANGMALICEHVLFMKFAFVAFRLCVSFLFSFSLVLIKQIRHSWHRTKKKLNECWNAVCNCSCL